MNSKRQLSGLALLLAGAAIACDEGGVEADAADVGDDGGDTGSLDGETESADVDQAGGSSPCDRYVAKINECADATDGPVEGGIKYAFDDVLESCWVAADGLTWTTEATGSPDDPDAEALCAALLEEMYACLSGLACGELVDATGCPGERARAASACVHRGT